MDVTRRGYQCYILVVKVVHFIRHEHIVAYA